MFKSTRQLAKGMVLLLFPIAATFLTGCQSAIDPGAFNQFAESTVELREGVDEVLGHQYELARERFVEEAAAGDEVSEEKAQALLLEEVEGKPFDWKTAGPPVLFLEARQFREGVRALNDVLVQYAELLAELAIVGRMDEEEFRATAEGINTGLREAASSFDDSDNNKTIAIFSTGATGLFQQYLNSQSKKKLGEALEKNQVNIRAMSKQLQVAMAVAAEHAFAEYSPRSMDLIYQLGPESDLSPTAKKGVVLESIELNELLVKRLDTLRRLDDSYRALPGANRELAASLEKGESGLASIYRIRDNAKRMRDLYKELEKPADEEIVAPNSESDEE